jgi:class 3 adenylate cyclase
VPAGRPARPNVLLAALIMTEPKKNAPKNPPKNVAPPAVRSATETINLWAAVAKSLANVDLSNLAIVSQERARKFEAINRALRESEGTATAAQMLSGPAGAVVRRNAERQDELEVELQAELKALRHRVKELEEKGAALTDTQAEAEQLKDNLNRIGEIQKIQHLLQRVNDAGQQQLLENPSFRTSFSNGEPTDAFVVSIDIRRSTDLMLKARDPKLYAEFLLTMAVGLKETVVGNFGVFDKFTGDGVLAFFPSFYTGHDAGLWAVKTAIECHDLFARHYRLHRSSFTAILNRVGLGIGIDYGRVHIVEIGADVTVVGTPVVYACRMSGAPAGTTLVNQLAYEQLFLQHGEYCDFAEVALDAKHEGELLAHAVTSSGKPFSPSLPSWAE